MFKMDYAAELSKVGKQIFDRIKEEAVKVEGVDVPKDMPIYLKTASGIEADYAPKGGEMVFYGTTFDLADKGVGLHLGADGMGQVHDGWNLMTLRDIKTEKDYLEAKGYLDAIAKDCEKLVYNKAETVGNKQLGDNPAFQELAKSMNNLFGEGGMRGVLKARRIEPNPFGSLGEKKDLKPKNNLTPGQKLAGKSKLTPKELKKIDKIIR